MTELKKSSRAYLENKRSTFVQTGLVISGGFCSLAFEWTSKVEKAATVPISFVLQ
jgi:protein TonB